MALTMIRNNPPSGAPPLPARHPSQSGTPVKSGRSQSVDHTVHHVQMLRQTSGGAARPSEALDVARPNHMMKRSVETKSFIDRNTAKVFSNPESYTPGSQIRRKVDHVEYPKDENLPPPPPITTLPRKHSTAGDRQRSTPGETAPPPPSTGPPPGRKSEAAPPLPSMGTRPVRKQEAAPPPPSIGPPPGRKPDPQPTSPPARPPKQNDPPPCGPKMTSVNPGPVLPPKSLPLQPERQPERPPKTIQSPRADQPPERPAKSSPGAISPTSAPMRPQKKSSSFDEENLCMSDLERRFCFHESNEFPSPEPMSGVKKTRSSMTQSMYKLHQREQMGYL